jgi:uncharacterized protein YjbJ (UPF0337 family)
MQNSKDQVRNAVSTSAKEVRVSMNDIKAKIRTTWPRITEQALEDVSDNLESLTSKIQQAYGYTREQAIKEFESFRIKHFSKSA